MFKMMRWLLFALGSLGLLARALLHASNLTGLALPVAVRFSPVSCFYPTSRGDLHCKRQAPPWKLDARAQINSIRTRRCLPQSGL